jgi:ATP-dependent DNA helicase RecG
MRSQTAPSSLRPDTPIQYLKGVGEKRAGLFARLGVRTALDLVWHIPHRYLDASSLTPLARARVGEEISAVGRVVATRVLPTRKGLRIFHAMLRDESGMLECVWPGQAFLDRSIRQGQLLLVSGPVRFYHGRQLAPREYIILGESESDTDAQDSPVGRVLPVYPATEGLSHRQIRALVERHLDQLIPLIGDLLPAGQRASLGLRPLPDALAAVHRPENLEDAELGRRRLAFDELFDLQLMLARARALAKRDQRGQQLTGTGELSGQLLQSLPWRLTGDQDRALGEIRSDMAMPERMHRLLMGDVGTGKTVVALLAMLTAVESDAQAVLMAPTELLAEQHALSLTRLLTPLGMLPEILLGRMAPTEKSAARRRLASGAARIAVGTHALLQENVSFRRLGLVVIDEQHRFGVEQRAALIGKGAAPDVLLLSATPIPRSLALTLYGDLDVSTIREKPPGRGRVRTAIRTGEERERVWTFVGEECARGRQVYVVLPVIEESEKADLRAATTMAEHLRKRFPQLDVGLVHGRLKPDERDQVMRRFRDGAVQILVATTVIEVGIDVPNATIMVIEHPERFGLAQLHQLRGRVGRGEGESYAILLSDGGTPDRLRAFAATDDGFRVAELDLQERGMGDLLGQRQSGGLTLRHARLADDADLLDLARRLAREIVEKDPALARPGNAVYRERVGARFPRAVELFRTG